jgi:hypothetical protein
LEIFGSYDFDKTFWETSGRVVSLLDLEGAQIILIPTGGFHLTFPTKIEDQLKIFNEGNVETIRRHLIPRTLMFKFAEGRQFDVGGEKFEKISTHEYFPLFSITLPDSIDNFGSLSVNRDCEDVAPKLCRKE